MVLANKPFDGVRSFEKTHEMENLYIALAFNRTYEKMQKLCEETSFGLKHYLPFYVKDYEDLQLALVEAAVDISNNIADRKKLCIALAEYTTSNVVASKLFDSMGKNCHVIEKIAGNRVLSTDIRLKFFNSANDITLKKVFLETGNLPVEAYLKGLKSPDLYKTVITSSEGMCLPDVQDYVVRFATSKVRSSFCKSDSVKYLSDELLQKLIARGEAVSLASNSHVPLNYQSVFVNLNNIAVDIALADNEQLARENISILVERGNNHVISRLSHNLVVDPNILPWEKIPHNRKVYFLRNRKISDKFFVLGQCFDSYSQIIREAARSNFPTKDYWQSQLVFHLIQKGDLDEDHVKDLPLEWLEALAETLFSENQNMSK